MMKTLKARDIAILLGLFLGGGLFALSVHQTADFSPEDAALGPFTVARDAVFEGLPVIFRNGDGMGKAREVFRSRLQERKQLALWLGASHLYSINNYHPGEEIAVYHANKKARERSSPISYLGIGLPNGNLNEFLAIFLHLREAGLLPTWLIIGVVYDDLREPGIRPKVRKLAPGLDLAGGKGLGVGGGNLHGKTDGLERDREKGSAIEDTPQERLEKLVVGELEKGWVTFASRHRLSAFINWKLRTHIFSVGEAFRKMGNPAKRVPPVPLDLKQWNEGALDEILRIAREDEIEVVLYKAPHPQVAGPFYHIRKRYDGFFEQLENRCGSEGIHYLDIETLVPLEYWMFGTAIDPWHFQEKGHRLLAEAIDSAMQNIEEKDKNALQ